MIFGFVGNMRGGKTLGASLVSLAISEVLNIPVYANYPLFHPNYKYFEKWKEIKDVTNSIIIYDEIGTSMDSRNYKSEDQITFTHLFAQMGKLGNTFMYTAQRMHSVEKRVRDNTDYFIYCERLWPTNSLRQTWFDTQQSVEEPTKIIEYIIEHPEKIYGIFDSFAVVKTQMNTGAINAEKKSGKINWRKRSSAYAS